MMNTMVNNLAPSFLCRLTPPSISILSDYPLRNRGDLVITFCRLSLTTESFVPSTIRLWNKLDPAIRNIPTISKFKKTLQKQNLKHSSFQFHSYGPKKLNIILTQMRCGATFLNYDLSRVGIIQDPSCRCGDQQETIFHFFFECPQYAIIRRTLFENLMFLSPQIPRNLSLFLTGDKYLSEIDNLKVLDHVFEFILHSKRFHI